MLYRTFHRSFNNVHFFRSIKQYLEDSYKSMSTTGNTLIEEDTDIEKSNNKRPMLDENNENAVKIPKVEEIQQKVKKKKHALLMGYLGKNYYGMQRNPGMKTIEEDLLTALLKADVISQEDFEFTRQIAFQRAARTDKGVSAARQVVSLKLQEGVDRADINQHLPNDIRVFEIKRVTKGFNSKIQCDSRTYRYVIPTYAFASEDDPSAFKSENLIDLDKRLEELLTINGAPYNEFRLSEESLNRINKIFKLFEGTHKFHNFTSKLTPLDPRSKRYIISFSCVETFVSQNHEFAVLEVKGQSFVLHQIRKMVAMGILVARNIFTEEDIARAFQPKRIDIPIAPSLGLSLYNLHFERYNKRYGSDGIHELLDWKESAEEVEQFQREYILQDVIDTEVKEKTTLQWLGSLANHTYREDEVIEEVE